MIGSPGVRATDGEVDPNLPELIAAARAGDARARDGLARHLLPRVLGWVGRLGGIGVDREEAAHDVLLVVLRRLDELDGAERLEAWTFGVTRRVAAAHRRRAWLRRWTGRPPPDLADPRAAPDADAEERDRARRVQILLDALPADQREALVLCDAEGRSAAEAAGLLGVPEGTVKSRLRLGRARFETLARRRDPALVPPPPQPGADR